MTMVDEQRAEASSSDGFVVLAGFLALAALNLVFWRFDYPPLIDWPNHLARHSLQCASDPMAGLGRYYVYDFVWVPNLTSELVHALPFACASLLTTQKVLFQFATTGLLAAALILHFAVWRHWSVWPLLAAFGTHHMALGYGFENYVLALPPLLLSIAAWFLLRERGAVTRLLPLVPVAGGLYLLHLYAFMFFFGVIGLLELQKWWVARRLGTFLLVAGLMAAMAAGPVLHLVLSATRSAGIDVAKTEFGTVLSRLRVVLSPFTALGVPYLDAGILRAAALQLLGLCAVWGVLRFIGRPVRLKRGTLLAVCGMALVTVAMPPTLGAVHLSDIRFPVAFLCLALAVTDVRLTQGQGTVLALSVVAACAWRASWLEPRWAAHDREVRELLSLNAALSEQDRILVARAGPASDVLLHSHSASHLAREVGVFLPEIFSGGNAITARPQYAARDNFQTFPILADELVKEARNPRSPLSDDVPYSDRYWTNWPEFYTHVLVLGRNGETFSEVPEFGSLIRRGTFFALYRSGS